MEKNTNDQSKEVTPSRLELEDRDLTLKMEGSQLNNAAANGEVLEHELTLLEAIKAYPIAIMWALLVSMCVIMEGYDTILIGNFYAYPEFAKKYGTYFAETDGYQLTAAWQAGLGNASGRILLLPVKKNPTDTSCFRYRCVLRGPPQRLSCRQVRSQTCHSWRPHIPLSDAVHRILCSQHPSTLGRTTHLRSALGDLCDDCSCICIRGFAAVSSCLPYKLHKHGKLFRITLGSCR